jgi:hypothetical protein
MNTAGSGFRYLPSRPRDAQWGLHVSGAGWATVPAGSAYPPPGHPELYDFSFERGRRLPEYQVVYIAAGSGAFLGHHGNARGDFAQVAKNVFLCLLVGCRYRGMVLFLPADDFAFIVSHDDDTRLAGNHEEIPDKGFA